MTNYYFFNKRLLPLFIALLMGFLGKTPLLAQNTYPEGALPGVFSVSGNTFVCFSQGNLQYIGSAGNGDENNTGAYWRFAEHQWDYLGDNGQGSDSKTVDRDLFCWGTSGYNHGANCYQPWSISESQSDYYAYGSDTYNLYDESGQADWGYNAISNGGNQENSGWRTLTHEEWEYLFNARNTASGIRYAMATVNNVNGMIILPDDWDASYYMLSNTNTPGVYSSNTISETEWVTLEQHGAVFLSAGGNRYGISLNWVGYEGYYWSASYLDSNRAYGMGFSDNDLYSYGMNCYGGRSTRLVCPVQGYFGINATPNPAKGGVVSGYGTYAEGTECTLTATASAGFAFVNWTENDEVVSTEATYSFTVTGYRNLVANFVSESNTELGDTWYDWQSNGGPITRTVVWPDGKVNFAFTQALDYSFSNRGTGIGTYDAVNNEWIASEGRVENEKTGFGSIARYGENGIVVAAHTAYDCRIYLISDKENIPYNSLEATSILDNTYEPYWPNVMTSGANRDIIHVIATASDADGWLYGSQVYFRSTDGGNTWDKQNVILPFMGPEDCGGWQSNSCYWMETTDDNCLALVVNNVWSDGMVIYSYDDGETWQRKVFYKHPNPFGSFDEPFFYPRWTSCQWDSQHHLHVLYELGAVSGDVSSYDGMMNENYALGGVAYWNEDMPYNLNGTSVSAIEGNLIPGQPFVMDSAYLSHDIYQSWWLLSDAPHEM